MTAIPLKVLLALLIVSISSACAMQQKKTMASLSEPQAIDCTMAEGDIRVLEHEKAHVAGRVAEGVTAIVPTSLVIGLLTGTEGTKVKVATGEYNEAIDKRIAEIKQTCHID